MRTLMRTAGDSLQGLVCFLRLFRLRGKRGESRPGVSPARGRRLPPARFLALAKRLMGEPASGARLPRSRKSRRRGAGTRSGARPRPSSRAIRRLQGGLGRRTALEEGFGSEGCGKGGTRMLQVEQFARRRAPPPGSRGGRRPGGAPAGGPGAAPPGPAARRSHPSRT